MLHYGDVRLRVRRTLWQEVEPEGFEIGDWVEVLSRGMLNEPRTGIIREMLWDERERAMRYQIFENGQPIEQAIRARGFAARGAAVSDAAILRGAERPGIAFPRASMANDVA